MIRISTSETNCSHDPQTSCGTCRLNTLCLPLSLHLDDVDQLNRIVQRGRPLHKGEHLYRAEDPFDALFAIRSGAVKASTLNEQGEEQVTGFYLPGELVGLDGIADNRYTNTVVALETSSICEIPFEQVEDLSLKIPSLQRNVFQLLSREITQDQQLISLLSKSSAEERVATLLLSLSSRHQRRKLSPTAFRLPMSRTDIGNFLGLTIETISRVFSRLQQQKVLSVDKKEIHILDMEQLRQLASQRH
ncbi:MULTISPECIES: fumarate/nitrate reduction transcriptional regulator Fnr [Marinimicrobium]|uniref:CRP/FNR family transcriptional regulator n=2 Tax=Marinimicrobium TaxID=359337 RepID=A0A3N1NZ52_9GAMM|nr:MULTISPECIES: fumarate/nitrate reduction transcriptional regulator Fnr [Marinimicrobium]ROQ20671.1 CRP/FNR family transcriptional regulator [Marinimicrobium koreense]